MNKELIERLALEAEFPWMADQGDEFGFPVELQKFAQLVAEECAKIAEVDSSTAGEAIRQAFKAE